MKIVEFRILLPLTVEEYQVAQLYSVAEASKNETGGGEGIEVVENVPFGPESVSPQAPSPPLLDGYTSGQYTHKIYHLQSKVPAIIRLISPKGALEIVERAWNAYPYCRTVVSNPKYMKEKFEIKIETMHKQDDGKSENVHGLSPEKLKKREVIYIDIANDKYPKMKEADPRKYKSEKTGRGPLEGANWPEKTRPLMCAYKLVSCEFVWFGLQGRIESYIQKIERRIFCEFHRQLFCWTDKWHGMTMEDIRAIEERTKHELDEQRVHGAIRGTTDIND